MNKGIANLIFSDVESSLMKSSSKKISGIAILLNRSVSKLA